MKKLIKGIIDFREKSLVDYRAKFSKLAYGQSPDVLFFACCDSRVVPNVFASTDPGDLFVMRNIGNLVPPFPDTQSEHTRDTSVAAAIEFSLSTLNVNHIVICGHSECAAMMQFFAASGLNTGLSNLDAWLKYAAPSYERFKSCTNLPKKHLSPHNVLSQINVLQQLDHLKTYPSIKKRLENKTLNLHGWWFELDTADVYQHEPDEDEFLLIDADHAEKILESL